MPRQIAAPAATAMIPAFVNGAIGSRILDNCVWATALTEDPVTIMLLDMVASPAIAPARQGHFAIRDKILFMREIFQNDDRCIELKIVPESLQNIIFVAFHSNPIGGHLNAHRTYHRVRQRYFWPGMCQYIRRCAIPAQGAACQISRRTDLLILSIASLLKHL